MLKEAEQEYTEIDIARENQIDPFAKDKVLKIETQVAQKRTTESLRYGEDLMDALELSEVFREEIDQYMMSLEIYELNKQKAKKAAEPEKPRASIKFLGRNIFEHILLHLRRIRSPELENTIQFLNQKQCFALLFYLEHFLRNQIQIELVTRAIFYIIKTYQVQLKQNSAMLPIMKSISLHLKGHFKELRDEIGVNVSAIKIIKKDLNQQRNNAGNDEMGLDFSKPEDGFNFAFWMNWST